MLSYIREVSATQNSKVNFEKLYVQLKSSTVPMDSVDGINGKIYVNVPTELTAAQVLEMDAVIAAHDGAEPLALDSHAIEAREHQIRELNQLAQYSDHLDNIQTVDYLTSIDNWINAYVRSGINDVLVAKIAADAADSGGPFFAYLHTVVNEAGNKTFEYFIAKIQGLI